METDRETQSGTPNPGQRVRMEKGEREMGEGYPEVAATRKKGSKAKNQPSEHENDKTEDQR